MTYDYNSARPRAGSKRANKQVGHPQPDKEPQKSQAHTNKVKKPILKFDDKRDDAIQPSPLDVEHDDDTDTDFPYLDYLNKYKPKKH